MMITLYGRAGCMPCRATKKFLEKNNIDFTYVDVDSDQNALNTIISLGYNSVPVVQTGSTHWSGYNPERLNELL